jgi:hypothetical protein
MRLSAASQTSASATAPVVNVQQQRFIQLQRHATCSGSSSISTSVPAEQPSDTSDMRLSPAVRSLSNKRQHLYFSFISNSHFGGNNRAACVIRIINRFEFSFQLSVSSFDCSDDNGKAPRQPAILILCRCGGVQLQQLAVCSW